MKLCESNRDGLPDAKPYNVLVVCSLFLPARLVEMYREESYIPHGDITVMSIRFRFTLL